MSEDEELWNTPPDVVETAKEIVTSLLPPKSREIYECAYNRFLKWCCQKNVKIYSENVLLAYFADLSSKMKCSTLWSHYSMIKATLNLKNGVDIRKYSKLHLFLKRQNDGYIPKKSRVLTLEQINHFVNNAPDEEYLLTKVVLILGVAGACRCDELVRMKLEDIQDVKSALLIKIPYTKSNKARSFTVMGEKYLSIYRKYVALRPQNYDESRVFIRYKNGKCQRMVVGIHKISSVAQTVANYLKLDNANAYTGHCLRRTSATLLVDSGGDLTCLKRHGGWKSSSVAEGYIEESEKNKTSTATKILRIDESSITNNSAPILHDDTCTAIAIDSKNNDENVGEAIVAHQDKSHFMQNIEVHDIVNNSPKNVNNTIDTSGLVNFYQGCSNCTFNININK